MFPVFFKLGPVTLYTYGLLVAAGFSTGIVLSLYLGKNENIPREYILDISFYSLAAAIIGSRLFFVLIEYKYFLSRPFEIFKIWEGGLVFYGGLLAVIPVVFIYFKKHSLPSYKILDVFAPSFALGHAIGRIGCFSAGCCFGKPTELPWGVIFSHPDTMAITGISLHPTQLYESAAEFGIFITLMVMRKNRRFKGQIIWMYVLLYSVARFIIELFRGDPDRGFIYNDFSIAQGISVILIVSSLYFLRSLKNKQLKDN
jgi:phosphatidylglycerol:prolipoprotein diacylglycerol transferase